MARAEAILLDFDGPVCRLFSGLPAPQVADGIRAILRDRGADLPQKLQSEPDPLVLLRWTADSAPSVLRDVERAQERFEQEAAAVADPTPGASELLRAAAIYGTPVAIVSNNSASAIQKYLNRSELGHLVEAVVGRVAGRPTLMKPEPYLVHRGAAAVGAAESACVFIGDSPSDMTAGKKAGTICIGYAKRETRIPELTDAGADIVLEDMQAVADAIEEMTLP